MSQSILSGFASSVLPAILPAILLMSTVNAQSQKPWTQPRTADGQPDLQGIWTNPTITPFERSAEFAGKPTLTDAEAAAIEQRAAKGRVDGPAKAGDVGTYNQFWTDGGTKWVSTRAASLVVEPSSGKVPIKPAAEAQRDYDVAHVGDNWIHQTTWDRCITRGVPAGMFPAGYNNAYQILQTPGYVVILSEMIHEVRFIPLDGRPHLPSNIRQWNGDSRGHWEGDTLVVDTTNYSGQGMIATSAATGRVKGIHESESLHVVERFKRVDANTISYEASINDPEEYTAPWKVSIPLNKDANYRIYEYACHEGNEAMGNILRAGRVAEKEGKGSK